MFKAHTLSVSWVSCFYVTPWQQSHRELYILQTLTYEMRLGIWLGRRWWPDITKTQFETSIRVLSGPNILPGLSRVITHTLGWVQQLINIDPKADCAEMKTGKLCALVRKLVSLLHSPWKHPVSSWCGDGMKCAGSSYSTDGCERNCAWHTRKTHFMMIVNLFIF